jgi:hypothetical protein
MCNGNFLGIGADACNRSVVVEKCAPYGLLITNGEFVADKSEDPTQVVVNAENQGVVRFNNSAFWGGATRLRKLKGLDWLRSTTARSTIGLTQKAVQPSR